MCFLETQVTKVVRDDHCTPCDERSVECVFGYSKKTGNKLSSCEECTKKKRKCFYDREPETVARGQDRAKSRANSRVRSKTRTRSPTASRPTSRVRSKSRTGSPIASRPTSRVRSKSRTGSPTASRPTSKAALSSPSQSTWSITTQSPRVGMFVVAYINLLLIITQSRLTLRSRPCHLSRPQRVRPSIPWRGGCSCSRKDSPS
jgi:hypothetical protein